MVLAAGMVVRRHGSGVEIQKTDFQKIAGMAGAADADFDDLGSAAEVVELLFGKLADNDEQQDDHKGADHRPDPHPSARPSIHPAVSLVHHKKFWLRYGRPTF